MRIAVADLTFDVRVEGPADAPAALLLHGFPQTSHSWRLVLPYLQGFRVVAPDQRGYSPDARPSDVEAYRLPRLVADALALLDALGIDRAHVVGHDWGAAVAWQLGTRHADRVRTLTAVSVPHPRAFIEALRSDADQRRRSAYMRDFATSGFAEVLLAHDARRLRRVFGDASAAVDVDDMVARAQQPGALEAWLRWYAAQRSEDLADTPSATVPTMHVWSDGDLALGRAGAAGTAAFVDGPYRFEVLPGVSHWIPEEAADQLGPLLLDFFASAAPE